VGKLLLFILLIAAATAAWLWYSINHPYQGFSVEGVFVEVPHGSSSRSVARLLERKGVVRSSVAFEFYARRHPRRSLQAGEYFFDRATSAHDVFWKLANGQVFEQPFTVREGETMFDIARDLEAGKFMPADDFLRDIAPQAATLEGFLFPATYHLSRHPSATALTTDMVRKFREEWNAVTTAIVAGDGISDSAIVNTATPSDSSDSNSTSSATLGPVSTRPITAVVTLASLVERETPRLKSAHWSPASLKIACTKTCSCSAIPP
jgi:cell division protein YceG involved in septum cleavage